MRYFTLRAGLVSLVMLLVGTIIAIDTPDLALRGNSDGQRFQVLDRRGKPLGVSYQNRFNTIQIVPLHDVPTVLRHAFVTAEDKRFFEHHGVDWQARFSAIWQNIKAGRAVRGASTITEQVVRIIHPRPRHLWSRWLEGFEAMLLERRASKGQILEFYLNQVPYAANRRGIAQAARYYFNRDLDTLTQKEMLALAILPRAPSALDLYKHPDATIASIARLAQAMQQRGELSMAASQAIVAQPLALEPSRGELATSHFIHYIRETTPYHLSENGVLRTTLDSDLQRRVQALLDERVSTLKRKKLHNGAAMVVDHRTGEILVWAIAGAGQASTPGQAIDAVRAPRQPGSALKPFLYALALDSGWSPATQLDDAPMAEAIGTGLHDFHNYSHTFYGKISLREALGNSLNIPALETIGFVRPARYLKALHALGFDSLTQPASYYKDGLALGTGEVSLFEMVQAYAALAQHGAFRPLTPLPDMASRRAYTRIYSPEAASLIGHILSDPYARRREFGGGSVLNLPVQTATKTGTSTDYRDAWVLGYNAQYVVGVWFGNLDQTPMDGVTGSTGPALVLRSIFAALNEHTPAQSLRLSRKLVAKEICAIRGSDAEPDQCFPYTEYFIPGTEPTGTSAPESPRRLRLVRPTKGLQLAYDPRIPASMQAFEFVADGGSTKRLAWWLDGKKLGETSSGRLLWPVARGHHTLVVRQVGIDPPQSAEVHFNVK